jgi:hypothetical protein
LPLAFRGRLRDGAQAVKGARPAVRRRRGPVRAERAA